MKGIAWGLTLALTFLLTACATTAEKSRMDAYYEKFDAHCREHARDMTAEVDEEERYRECMAYFMNSELHCPKCVLPDPHLTGSKE